MKNKKHTQGFQVEKDYFDSFEERMMLKLKESKLPKQQGFTTPPSYFESLEERICDRLNENDRKTKVIPFVYRKSFRIAVSMAACVALLVTIVLSQNETSDEALNLATITEYIDEGYLELSDEELGSLLNEDDLSQMTLIPMENTESIEDYLLEHLDENNLLIE
ncbi:MAG: hypothetical protein HKM28_02485 [Flavobacteriaceae bacterium]|nr:hypothetical protein [Flavobacteriaceae bacterium]